MSRECKVADCTKPTQPQKRMCSMHLRRLHRHGSVDLPTRLVAPIADRFWSKVTEGPGGCWTWTASAHNGYGRFGDGGRTVKAHRWAYEYMVGEIPEGLVIDHLCLNRSCVNPDHMDPVPQSVNAARSNAGPNHNAGKTHCKRGHEYTPENTGRSTDGARYCRTCMRMHHDNWAARTGWRRRK